MNTSLFVLIWIVQLVIYPGFTYYQESDIKKWHPAYTRQITFIVMPLMLAQLGLYSYAAFKDFSLVNLIILVLIIFNWVITFLKAVPLHGYIDNDDHSIDHRIKLVRINWPRTIAWTLILIISLIDYGA